MEVVNCQEFFSAIYRELPGETKAGLERRCGYAPKSGVFANMERNRQWIRLETADSILTALDLSHLLSTGDIKVQTAKQFLKGGELCKEESPPVRTGHKGRDKLLRQHSNRNSKLMRRVNQLLDERDDLRAKVREYEELLAEAS